MLNELKCRTKNRIKEHLVYEKIKKTYLLKELKTIKPFWRNTFNDSISLVEVYFEPKESKSYINTFYNINKPKNSQENKGRDLVFETADALCTFRRKRYCFGCFKSKIWFNRVKNFSWFIAIKIITFTNRIII